jgi:hypothetical protein
MLTGHSSLLRPTEDGRTRRWFSDDYFDLIVWHDWDQTIRGFQLCYDKPGRERAFTWTVEEGFRHDAVDSGEMTPEANRAPVLTASAAFPLEQVRGEFEVRSATLDSQLRELVLAKLREFDFVLANGT